MVRACHIIKIKGLTLCFFFMIESKTRLYWEAMDSVRLKSCFDCTLDCDEMGRPFDAIIHAGSLVGSDDCVGMHLRGESKRIDCVLSLVEDMNDA